MCGEGFVRPRSLALHAVWTRPSQGTQEACRDNECVCSPLFSVGLGVLMSSPAAVSFEASRLKLNPAVLLP